jgi:hypothetical protein
MILYQIVKRVIKYCEKSGKFQIDINLDDENDSIRIITIVTSDNQIKKSQKNQGKFEIA